MKMIVRKKMGRINDYEKMLEEAIESHTIDREELEKEVKLER